MKKPWSEKDVVTATKILEKHTSVPAACKEISKRLKRPASVSNLRDLFTRRGLDAPNTYLKAPEAPKETPLARKQRETNLARLKREHAELLEQVKEAEAREAVRSALGEQQPLVIQRRELGSGLREGAFCALLSDIHSEEMVEPDDSTFHNAYSLEIADLRLGRFFTGIEWMLQNKRTTFQLRDVVLWLGGDLMTGQIHEENVETGQLTQVETLLWLRPRITAGIKQILSDPKVETLNVVCSYGNHGRNTRKPMRARGAQHSYEWLMYQFLADDFKDEKRVRFTANPKGHQYLGVYDFMTHWHHGDETRFQGGVGGIMIPLNKAIARWNDVKRADFHNIGHYHQYIQTRFLTANGSGIGYNDYAMSIGATPEPAQQACYIIDSKRGKTEKSPLWLEDRSSENALRVARGWAKWQEAA
jgi:hypothetical protein